VVELNTSQPSMFSFGLQNFARYQGCVISDLVLDTPPLLELISQCSLHNAPIFRLLLKVAVNGTHQCESLIFCGTFCPNLHLLTDFTSVDVQPRPNAKDPCCAFRLAVFDVLNAMLDCTCTGSLL
jgi:hypothetical protein